MVQISLISKRRLFVMAKIRLAAPSCLWLTANEVSAYQSTVSTPEGHLTKAAMREVLAPKVRFASADAPMRASIKEGFEVCLSLKDVD